MAEPRIITLTDTHFGARKGSQIFHDYFEKFYTEVFFPYLDSSGLTTVVHLGDSFDVRKNIDYWSLDWSKRVFFEPLKERGIDLHMIVGNHDIFYKQTLSINSPVLNLAEYDNITIYDRPTTATINGHQVFMVPWLCEANAEEFVEELAKTKAKHCFGHLELAGFQATKGYMCEHGTDVNLFSKFDQVFSGHFHKQSTSGNVRYLGNTYQMFWNDEGDKRGFHEYNLKTQELKFVENPNVMFNKLYYNEEKKRLINPHKYANSYVKLIVEGTSTPAKLHTLIDNLYQAGVHDVKIIENLDLSLEGEVEIEAEDTLTTLTNYVNAMDDEVNKNNLIEIFKSLYVEAQEV